MNTLLDNSIQTLHKMLLDRKISAVDLVEEVYARIEKIEPQIHAFTHIRPKSEVIQEANNLSPEDLASSYLAGIPYALKDSYVTTNTPTTAGSAILDGFISPYNATVYQSLNVAKALLIGKCSMDAWGHGATSENTDFEIVKNPHDLSRSAGGSTGGVAAAIAARLVSFGIGEDTGGSIRNPASWNNITGLKVSYGRVSRYGCIAYASSFDTVGPMAKSANDCALVLNSIAGRDSKDATSAHTKVDAYHSYKKPNNISIGIPEEILTDQTSPEVKRLYHQAIDWFEGQGYTVKHISMPTLPYGLAVYYLIGPSETSSNLARYDGIRFGQLRDKFTNETKRRIMLGTYALSSGYYDAYYKKGLLGRTVLINEYKKAFQKVDVILTPVTPTPAPKLGELIKDPITNMMADMYTVTQNPVGIPSIAIPAGFTSENLPLGIQVSGPMFQEKLLFDIAHHYQLANKWHEKPPSAIEKI